MAPRYSAQLLEPKTKQIERPRKDRGYLYYCGLCNEALILSAREINSRKISLVLSEACPSCGFELDKVLRCESFEVLEEPGLFVNPKCTVDASLLERKSLFKPKSSRGTSLPRDTKPSLTTGIDALDKILILRFGQLAVLHGEASHSLSLLLCVRAGLPPPLGIDSDVVFIDGGNLFNSFKISQHSTALGLEFGKVQERIHLSRAFTHHQLSSLITEKLPHVLEKYKARLAVISDITLLYCDPDVRDKKEALDLFRKCILFLAKIAEQKGALVLITSLQSRNKNMETMMTRYAHISGRLKSRGIVTHLTLDRHPFIARQEMEFASFGNQILMGYL